MEQAKIKSILTAPINLLRWSTEEERGVFSSIRTGDCFCTFGLSSGQTFVGRIPVQDGVFTFKPLHNLLPKLTRIEWKKAKHTWDLGYDTRWYTSAKMSEDEVACYKSILTPRPDTSTPHPLTKIAFKYYTYHPLLEQARLIQFATEEYKEKEWELIVSQRRLGRLLFSERKPLDFARGRV